MPTTALVAVACALQRVGRLAQLNTVIFSLTVGGQLREAGMREAVSTRIYREGNAILVRLQSHVRGMFAARQDVCIILALVLVCELVLLLLQFPANVTYSPNKRTMEDCRLV